MIKTFRRGRSAALRLGEDEAALDHGLDMQREALRRNIRSHAVFSHRIADVGLECLGVGGDGVFAGGVDFGVREVSLLDDGPHEAREFR